MRLTFVPHFGALPRERLIYTTLRPANKDLYLFEPGATAPRQITNDPALSALNPQPYGEIFVAPVDGGSEPIRLTHNRWEDSLPCWGVVPR